jgi:hypothetical protein
VRQLQATPVAVFIYGEKLMPPAITDKFRKSYSLLTKSLNSGISNVDTTIPLNNVTNIPTDTAVDCIIDRVDANGTRTPTTREIVKGVVSGTSLINCVRGLHGTTAQSHLSGAVVEFTVSAVANNDSVDGILAQHNQDGTHGAVTATSLAVSGTTNLTGAVTLPAATVTTSKLSTELQQGWEDTYGSTTMPVPNTVTANGNRSYSCVFNSVDLTGALSAGMRLRTTRTVSAPTQCTSLNGTSQYYSKSSPSAMTFTDDFVVSAWVKLSSYGTNSVIASRYNGTSGWRLYVETSGQVTIAGNNAGVGNYRGASTYQSLPLNKWVHVTAQLDMSTYTATTTTMYVMFDGVDVPVSLIQAGTNPTALAQPTYDLQIGAANATNFFPGKIAQVAIYNAKVTQATIKASISQGLSGSETSLISAYSFNSAITDLSANANNLTANGAAVATNADSPFGTQASGLISATLDYGIIQSVTFSTNTTVVVQVPEGCTIPTSGGVSAVSYSTQASPYGCPANYKFCLSVYDSAIATTMLNSGLNNPVSDILYVNAGAGGGTMRLSQNGNIKRLVGVTAQSAGIATNGVAQQAVTFPLTFAFAPTCSVTAANNTGDNRLSGFVSTITTTTLLACVVSNAAGAGATSTPQWSAEGI